MSEISKESPKSALVKFLEKIPGTISWILITAPIWAAYLFPNAYGAILLCFIVFLVMKSIRNLIYFIISYIKIIEAKKIDWKELNIKYPEIQKVKHFIIIPYANEPINVLYPTIEGLANQKYDLKNLYVCLTSEAKYPSGEMYGKEIISKYENVFGGIWHTTHHLSVGEVVGKSANMLNGARFCDQKIVELQLDQDYLTLTSCDCDSVFPPNYFALLASRYINEEDRFTIFWAGAMGYISNYWDLKYFSRVLNSHFTYYNISLLERSWFRFVQVSTYSASYRLFKAIDFYSPDVVPEDFHTFFKALFKFGSKVRCEGLPCVISSDASEGNGVWSTIVNQYKQVQRWAYGVADYPYIVINTFKTIVNKDFSFRDRMYVLYRSVNVLIDLQLWPTYGFILGIGFYLVLILNPALNNSAFWWRVPELVSRLWIFASSYYLVAYVISFNLRPAVSHRVFSSNFQKYLFFLRDTLIELLYWVFFPIISFTLAILPGLDAHTRLMFGKYLEYWVTEKK